MAKTVIQQNICFCLVIWRMAVQHSHCFIWWLGEWIHRSQIFMPRLCSIFCWLAFWICNAVKSTYFQIKFPCDIYICVNIEQMMCQHPLRVVYKDLIQNHPISYIVTVLWQLTYWEACSPIVHIGSPNAYAPQNSSHLDLDASGWICISVAMVWCSSVTAW